MTLLENQPEVCLFTSPRIKGNSDETVWCLRHRKCRGFADDFWESRLETPEEHWHTLHRG